MSYTPEQQQSIDEFQAALEKHCKEMGILDVGVFLSDWFIIGAAQNIDEPDKTIYWRAFSNGSQATHITAGLVKYASIRSESAMWNPTDEGGED